MATEINLTGTETRDDNGPEVMTLVTAVNGSPVKVTVEYEDPTAVLKFFYEMGARESILNLAGTMDKAYGSAKE
ncbi:hypothetical protein GS454_04700 [Rhodococcus hoagii]|nr:hypothetical protein [Prescottella equi]